MEAFREHIEQSLFERIEAYIRGDMDEASRVDFEKEIEADVLLSNEVTLQRRLMASVEVFTFNKNHWKERNIQEVPVRKIYGLWYAAAAAVVILALVWYFRYNATVTTDLYAKYYQPDTGLPVVMSGEGGNYHFYDGMVSYKEGDYVKALTIWNKLSISSDTLSYYKGVASLGSNLTSDAIPLLEEVAANSQSTFHEKAVWYLALAYLKKGDNEAAKKTLQRIDNSPQAEKLLKEIK